jgi:hypothetical protein
LKDRSIHSRDFSRARDIEVSHYGIGRSANRRQQPVQSATLLLKLAKPAGSLEDLNLSLEHIDRLLEL